MLARHYTALSTGFALALLFAVAPASAQQQDDFDAFFNRLDKNEDGKIAKDELPRNALRNFDRIDTDKDGFASREEMKAVFDRLQRNPNRERDNTRQRGPRVPESIEHHADISYAGSDNARQTLDLLLPKAHTDDDKPLPVVVFIHGGGWRGGHKNTGIGRLTPLVASGEYAGVTVGYRLTNEAQWPEQIYDCKAAIRWVRANAKKHNLDPDRIAVWGTSAGGHLVAMLGTSGDVKHLEGKLGPHTDVSSRVTCVVDWFGPADFTVMGKPGNADRPSAVTLLLGGSVADHPDKAKDASPQTYVSKDDPPFLILHGDKDALVPVDQSIQFDLALDEAGVNSTLLVVKGAGHGFGGEAINQAVKTFLDQQLQGVDSEPIKDGEIESRPRRRD